MTNCVLLFWGMYAELSSIMGGMQMNKDIETWGLYSRKTTAFTTKVVS